MLPDVARGCLRLTAMVAGCSDVLVTLARKCVIIPLRAQGKNCAMASLPRPYRVGSLRSVLVATLHRQRGLCNVATRRGGYHPLVLPHLLHRVGSGARFPTAYAIRTNTTSHAYANTPGENCDGRRGIKAREMAISGAFSTSVLTHVTNSSQWNMARTAIEIAISLSRLHAPFAPIAIFHPAFMAACDVVCARMATAGKALRPLSGVPRTPTPEPPPPQTKLVATLHRQRGLCNVATRRGGYSPL